MGKNRFDGGAVNVAPRRKKVGDTCVRRSKECIQISREMILALASKPLAKAAASVGISETALKRACRELGFNKWPRESIDVDIKLEDLVRTGSASSCNSASSPAPAHAEAPKVESAYSHDSRFESAERGEPAARCDRE
eukprot:2369685-Rhodomonas_salina.1